MFQRPPARPGCRVLRSGGRLIFTIEELVSPAANSSISGGDGIGVGVSKRESEGTPLAHGGARKGDGVRLLPTGRFGHTLGHVKARAAAAGFEVEHLDKVRQTCIIAGKKRTHLRPPLLLFLLFPYDFLMGAVDVQVAALRMQAGEPVRGLLAVLRKL